MGRALDTKDSSRPGADSRLRISGAGIVRTPPDRGNPQGFAAPPACRGSPRKTRGTGSNRPRKFHRIGGTGSPGRLDELRVDRLCQRPDRPGHPSAPKRIPTDETMGPQFSPSHPPLVFRADAQDSRSREGLAGRFSAGRWGGKVAPVRNFFLILFLSLYRKINPACSSQTLLSCRRKDARPRPEARTPT